MQALIASLFTCRAGFITTPCGWAHFRRGQMVGATPAIWNAWHLRNAHFEQIGF